MPAGSTTLVAVRLYLSSFRLGLDPQALLDLMRRGGPVVVIANALDAEDPATRAERVGEELARLAAIGLDADEIDLRLYLGRADELVSALSKAELVWLRGGNVFVLRHALARTSADVMLVDLLQRDEIVCGGYSAGPCVLGSTLRGLELVDDPAAVRDLWDEEPIWEGLAVVDYAVVPHWRSPSHPESERMNQVVASYLASDTPHIKLRDGEALVIHGEITELRGAATSDDV
jgi:dipeptidase E